MWLGRSWHSRSQCPTNVRLYYHYNCWIWNTILTYARSAENRVQAGHSTECLHLQCKHTKAMHNVKDIFLTLTTPKYKVVLVQVQVLVLDLSGPKSLRFCLGNIFGPESVHVYRLLCCFCFISYKPHFTSATKKKVTDVTAYTGWISHAVER